MVSRETCRLTCPVVQLCNDQGADITEQRAEIIGQALSSMKLDEILDTLAVRLSVFGDPRGMGLEVTKPLQLISRGIEAVRRPDLSPAERRTGVLHILDAQKGLFQTVAALAVMDCITGPKFDFPALSQPDVVRARCNTQRWLGALPRRKETKRFKAGE